MNYSPSLSPPPQIGRGFRLDLSELFSDRSHAATEAEDNGVAGKGPDGNYMPGELEEALSTTALHLLCRTSGGLASFEDARRAIRLSGMGCGPVRGLRGSGLLLVGASRVYVGR